MANHPLTGDRVPLKAFLILAYVCAALGGFAAPSLANELAPSETALGIDLDLSAAALDFRVNDVPILDPQVPLSTDAQIATQLTLNEAFTKGQNTISFAVQFKPNSEWTPGLHLRLHSWPAGTIPELFQGSDFVFDVIVAVSQNDPGKLEMTQMVGSGEPLVTIAEIHQTAGDGTTDGWNTWSVTAEVMIDFPQDAWQSAQVLEVTPELRRELSGEYMKLHSALAEGGRTAQMALAPYIHRLAGGVGASDAEYYTSGYEALLSGDAGFTLRPFDADESKVQLYGHGRLASLLPLPIRYWNPEAEQEASLFIYFWKDQTGQWQIIH
ncbi:MAG: hypothetical protein EP336_14860 [Rhodobacteraceae bacterium]|nr:MAG: hypothetical protein EP336_14860 [Paracoccaceae bacterium]